jgi:hypothetical protein
MQLIHKEDKVKSLALSDKMAQINPEDRMKATDRGVTAKMLSKFACILISVRIVPVSLNKKGNKINTSHFNRKNAKPY